MISSPRIEASFINSGSGSQDLKGLEISCDDKSILHNFKYVVSTPSDTTTTTISLPNNPRRTPNHLPTSLESLIPSTTPKEGYKISATPRSRVLQLEIPSTTSDQAPKLSERPRFVVVRNPANRVDLLCP